MQIVVLDGYTLNPGDLDWESLKKLGEVVIYERTPAHQVVDRCAEAEVVLTNKTPLTRESIYALPHLKLISVLATGYNIVDVAAAREKNIVVSNVPGYGTDSVVQLTFALMLEHYNQVGLHSEAVRAGEWASSKDFSFSKSPLHELSGKVLGLIGFGSIAGRVCDVASAFGMETRAYSRRLTDQSHRNNFQWSDLNELFKHSDVISIHCPLTEETKGMINQTTLALMKPSALLINTARGPIINEKDLAEALNTGVIAGAALDVLSQEPPDPDNPLLHAKNCLITPHIAWATKEARARLMKATLNNIQCFLNGKVLNVVN